MPPPLAVGAPGPKPGIIAGLIALSAVVCLLNSEHRDFWAPEEPDFAVATREMGERVAHGDPWALLVPTIGGESYLEKPPLVYWCALLSERITGLEPRIAYRIPAALAGALVLAVTYFAGRRFLGGRIAAAAVAIQATSYLQFHAGSWLLTDGIFEATVALSIFSFAVLVLQEPGRLRWALGAWTSLALAMLAKGLLLAPALVLGPVFLLIFFKSGVKRARREVLALRPFLGLMVLALLPGLWIAAGNWRTNGELWTEHVFHQHLDRLVDADSHGRPFWYYLGTIAADFLPWSAFLPLAVFHAHAQFHKPSHRFFALWVLWIFIALSLVSSKQGKYLLPLWPALSLLVASGLIGEERESLWERWLGDGVLRGVGWALRAPLPLAIIAAAAWGFGLTGSIELPAQAKEILSRGGGPRWIALFLVIGAGTFAASLLVRKRLKDDLPSEEQPAASGAAVAWIAGAGLLSLAAFTFTYEDLNLLKSARPSCDVIRAAVGEKRVAIYGRNRASVHYYLGRPLIHFDYLDPQNQNVAAETAKLDAYLDSPEEVFLLASQDDLESLRTRFPQYRDRLKVVRDDLRFSFHAKAALVTNRK